MKNFLEFDDLPLRVSCVIIMWNFLRLVSFPFTSNQDVVKLLRENETHQLGHGLAWSYWCGFLRILLYRSDEFQFSKALRVYTETNGVELETNDLLILKPASCNFPDTIVSARFESLEKEVEIPIPLEFNRLVKRPPICLKVYQVKAKSGYPRYNIIFDFPNVLKTSMGSPDDPEDSISDGLRKRNVRDFWEFLEQKLIASNQLGSVWRVPVRIFEFDDNDWFKEDGNPTEDYPDLLADVIINCFEKDIAVDEYSNNSDDTDNYDSDYP
jgi:hypothetical protein